MVSKRVLHALAVLVTILLFLARRALIKLIDNPMKKSELNKKNFFERLGNGYSYGAGAGDTSDTYVLPQSLNCAMSLNMGADLDDDCDDASPKYKKDPDIIFEDEDIGKYPKEYY